MVIIMGDEVFWPLVMYHFMLQQGKMEPSDHHVVRTSMKLNIKKLPHSYPVFKLINMNVKLICHGIKIDARTTPRDRTDCCHLAVFCRCLFSNFDIHFFQIGNTYFLPTQYIAPYYDERWQCQIWAQQRCYYLIGQWPRLTKLTRKPVDNGIDGSTLSN